MTYPIAHAVGDDNARDFKRIGIHTTERLLERASSPNGREVLSAELGISTAAILNYVNNADLLRIDGLGPKYIPLLHQATARKVVGRERRCTVRELKERNPENLMHKIALANSTHNIVEFLPATTLVARWIEQAKKLPLMVTYR